MFYFLADPWYSMIIESFLSPELGDVLNNLQNEKSKFFLENCLDINNLDKLWIFNLVPGFSSKSH